MEAIVVVWFAFLGGCFGSFLNVVIYRLPAGKTLLGNSGCPRCGHAIRPQHNIPVVGWLFLQGRCYDCQLRIAARYPLVELLVAAFFLALTFGEILPGGRNLPHFVPAFYPGVVGVILDPYWELLGIAAFHAAALTVLISWAYIAYDGHAVPAWYRRSTLLIILLLTIGLPLLVPTLSDRSTAGTATAQDIIRNLLTGILVGGLDWYAGALRGRWEPRRSAMAVVAAHVIIALITGTPAAMVVLLLTAVIRSLVFVLDRRDRLPWGLPLTFAALVHILAWNQFHPWSSQLSPGTFLALLLAATAVNFATARHSQRHRFAD